MPHRLARFSTGRAVGFVILIIVAAGMFAFAQAPPGAQDPHEAALQHVRALMEQGNYAQAVAAADRLLASEPPLRIRAEARIARADALMALRRYEEAAEELRAVLTRFPHLGTDPDLHHKLGRALERASGRSDAAVRHLTRAAELLEQAGRRDEAARLYIHLADRCSDVAYVRGVMPSETPWPEDPADVRRLQRETAIRLLDKAAELATSADVLADALFRQARIFEGGMYTGESDPDAAAAVYLRVAEELRDTDYALEALLRHGDLLARRVGDFEGAVASYRDVLARRPIGKFATRARNAIDAITAPRIGLRVTGPVPPGEVAEIHYSARNLDAVTLRAWRVDLFNLLREVGRLENLDDFQPAREPDFLWRHAFPEHPRFAPIESGEEGFEAIVPPFRASGAYVIQAEGTSPDGRPASDRALVLITRLVAISKGGIDRSVVFVADGQSGAPVAGADVLFQVRIGRKGFRYSTGRTNAEGLAEFANEESRPSAMAGTVVARDGDDYALCLHGVQWYRWRIGEKYRVYGFTDRPLYRPGQTVHIKQIVRRDDDGELRPAEDMPLELRIRDPKGTVVYETAGRTDAWGTWAGDFTLAGEPPLGLYRIEVRVAGARATSSSGNRFRVEAYRKPEFEVLLAPRQMRWRPGDEAAVDLEVRYYFGEPVRSAMVRYEVFRSPLWPMDWLRPMPHAGPPPVVLEEGRPMPGGIAPVPYMPARELVAQGQSTTDETGRAQITVPTAGRDESDEEDYRYEIIARVTDIAQREVINSATFYVTRHPFRLRVYPARYLWRPGERVRCRIRAEAPDGSPVRIAGRAAVHPLMVRSGDNQPAQYEPGEPVAEIPFATGADGRGQFEWQADTAGMYRIVVEARGDPGSLVHAEADVWVTTESARMTSIASRDLTIILDRDEYAVGETARVLLVSPITPAHILLTGEGDRLLWYRLIRTEATSVVLEVPIDARCWPNFDIAAMTVYHRLLRQERVTVRVPPTHRRLDVQIDLAADRFAPEEARIRVRTRDAQGNPIAADVALAVVDDALLALQPEFRPPIAAFFYPPQRPNLVRTDTSADYPLWASARWALAREARGAGLGDGMLPPPTARTAAPEQAAEGPLPEVRGEFPDTALWIARLRTGPDGTAEADIRWPDSLTRWRIVAVAADMQTRVGEAVAHARVSRDVLVRLQAPRFLVEGDRAHILAVVHNNTDKPLVGSAVLRIEGPVEIADPQSAPSGSPERRVTVPPQSTARVEWVVAARRPAYRTTLVAAVRSQLGSDAVQRHLPVLPFGSDQTLADSVILRGEPGELTATMPLRIPPDALPYTVQGLVQVSASTAQIALAALPFLIDYPYGCTEQTLSRFVPAALALRALDELGAASGQVEALADWSVQAAGSLTPWARPATPLTKGVVRDMAEQGLRRLRALQNSDGGWGWWPRAGSDPQMTAYATYALALARDAGIDVPADMLGRAASYLMRNLTGRDLPEWLRRRGTTLDADNVRLGMLFAAAHADAQHVHAPAARSLLARARRDPGGLTDTARAQAAWLLHRAGDTDAARAMINLLRDTAQRDARHATATWGATQTQRWWYDNPAQATAMALYALLAAAPDDPLVGEAVNGLVAIRRGRIHWYSTRDTAVAIAALIEYLTHSRELQPEMDVAISLDEKVIGQVRFDASNALGPPRQVAIAPAALGPADHELVVHRSGRGHVYATALVTYYTRQEPIPPSGSGLHIERRYWRAVPVVRQQTRRRWDTPKGTWVEETVPVLEYERERVDAATELRPGDLLDVQLTVKADAATQYVIVEDPRPAGCEPLELTGEAATAASGPFMEFHDDRVALFLSYLPAGERTIEYRLRCERPGNYRVLPARAWAMYNPAIRGNSASDAVVIVSEPGATE